MINLEQLKGCIPKIDFREKRIGLYKVLIPYFYEDGDMYDIFIEKSSTDNVIRISDYGLTLMKLSYNFSTNSDTRDMILQNIISQNRCSFDKGNIYLDVNIEQFQIGIYQFIQTITKVSNMDILANAYIKSMFYENLNIFLNNEIQPKYAIEKNYSPLKKESDMIVDYMILTPTPIFLFGVNSNDKASKVIISCLNFNNNNIINYRSLVIYEDINELNKFNQRRLMNIVDKQFYELNDFIEQGVRYLEKC